VYLLRNLDDPRRRLLIRLLCAGAFTLPTARALAQVLGDRPAKLGPDRSIYRLKGKVSVNGQPASLTTRIGPDDTVETGEGAEAVFAVEDSAFIARESTSVKFARRAGGDPLTNALRLLSGKLLAVFPPGKPQRMQTSTATLGIRGTGLYAESDPEQTYVCTCYGTVDIQAIHDVQSTKTVKARHHDEPVYVVAKAPEGRSIRPAPFINHTDQELMLIETLVGREPPFVFPSDQYDAPRRRYE
jgi:hypothetical protein